MIVSKNLKRVSKEIYISKLEDHTSSKLKSYIVISSETHRFNYEKHAFHMENPGFKLGLRE